MTSPSRRRRLLILSPVVALLLAASSCSHLGENAITVDQAAAAFRPALPGATVKVVHLRSWSCGIVITCEQDPPPGSSDVSQGSVTLTGTGRVAPLDRSSVRVDVTRHIDAEDYRLSNALSDQENSPYPNRYIVGRWLNLDIESFGNDVSVAAVTSALRRLPQAPKRIVTGRRCRPDHETACLLVFQPRSDRHILSQARRDVIRYAARKMRTPGVVATPTCRLPDNRGDGAECDVTIAPGPGVADGEAIRGWWRLDADIELWDDGGVVGHGLTLFDVNLRGRFFVCPTAPADMTARISSERAPSNGRIDSRRLIMKAVFQSHTEPPAWIARCRIVARD